MSLPWGWGTGEGALASWAIGCKTIAVGTHLHLLGRGRMTDMECLGWVMAPWRMLYRPLASNLATANYTCWRPLVPPPTMDNWFDAIGTAPKKEQEEDQVAKM